MYAHKGRVNTYRRAVFSRVSFFTWGTSWALQTRITSTASWACISTSTLGTVFARSTWWTWGTRIALGEYKVHKDQSGGRVYDISPYKIQYPTIVYKMQKDDPLHKNKYY